MSIGDRSGRGRAGLAAAAVLGLGVMLPVAGIAQSNADRCAASVQSGTMPSLATKGKNSRIVHSPLLEKGKYLALTLPDAYVEKLARGASGKPAGEQKPFVAEVVQRNFQLALSKVGPGGRASFDCAPLTDAFTAPAQRATSSSSAAPANARYTSDEITGGEGSKGSPFRLRLKKNRSPANDVSGQEIVVPVNFSVGTTVYFNVSVTLSQLGNSKISETYGEIVRIARLEISAMPAQRGGAVRLTSNLQAFKASVRRDLTAMERPEFISYIDSH